MLKRLFLDSDLYFYSDSKKNIWIKQVHLLNNSPERSRTAVFGSRVQKDCHYPTGLYYNIIMIIYKVS